MRLKPLLSSFCLLLCLNACAPAGSEAKRTGFFKEYESIEVKKVEDLRYFQRIDEADLGIYSKILLPDIRVMPNTSAQTTADNKLYAEISAYTTASYRKFLIKKSANYTLVDVPQEDALIMQIAISLVRFKPDEKGWDNLSALPFSLNDETKEAYMHGQARLLVEARTTDAMSSLTLSRSMHIIDEPIVLHSGDHLQFKDVHQALDRWLEGTFARQ